MGIVLPKRQKRSTRKSLALLAFAPADRFVLAGAVVESSSEGDLDDSPIIMARDDRLVLQRTLTRFQRQLDGLSVSVAEAQESLAAFSRRLVTPEDSDPDGDVEMVSGPGESFFAK